MTTQQAPPSVDSESVQNANAFACAITSLVLACIALFLEFANWWHGLRHPEQATLLPPPFFLAAMGLGWWAKKLCLRGLDVPGLGWAVTGVVLSYVALLVWYLSQIAIWLHAYPTVATTGLAAVLLVGVMLVVADGSRAARSAALGAFLCVLIFVVAVTWLTALREAARRSRLQNRLIKMVQDGQIGEKKGAGSKKLGK